MKPAKKTDAELKGAESRFESVAQLSGALVFIGLLIEAWAAVEYRPVGASITQTWEPAVSIALIAIGVFFEILFGRWALQQGAELRQRAERAFTEATERAGRAIERAAEANERAGKLEKEAAEARERTAGIERITAWRHISAEQGVQIADAIRDQAAILDVLIEHERGDPEAYSYARELQKVFANAGVRPKNIRGNPNSYMGVVWNLFGKSSGKVDASFIKDVFGRAGITIWMINEDLSAHLPRNERPPNLYIFVAPKPPPPLENWEMSVAEVAAAQSANARAAEVEARTAAVERAATSRQITPEQRANIVTALRDKLPLTFEQRAHDKIRRNPDEQVILEVFVESADDRETILFANQIKQIFEEVKTNFPVHLFISPTTHFGAVVFGVHAASVPPEYAEVVRAAFSDAGVPMPEDAEFTNGVPFRTSDHTRQHSAPTLRLYVGHKSA